MIETLAAIVGPEYARSAEGTDAIAGVRPRWIVEPSTVMEAAEIVELAAAAKMALAARGGGTKLVWGQPPERLDLVISTRRLNRLLEHSPGDMTATVEAGAVLADLQTVLAQSGQMLAIDAPFPDRCTVGGLVACDDSGALRLRYGGIRDLIIGITVIRSDGVVARGGGKVVKNVAGYDLPKLFAGSLGTLGFIATVTFRLHPLARSTRSLVATGLGPDQAGALVLDILSSPLMPLSLAVDRQHSQPARLFIRFGGLGADDQSQRAIAIAAQRGIALDAWDDDRTVWSGLIADPWSGSEPAAVLRCGILPSSIPATLAAIAETASGHLIESRVVLQGHGLGVIRLEGSLDALATASASLRRQLAEHRGTLVVLDGPPSLKQVVDSYGTPAGQIPLMQAVRSRFDPDGILNPGRLIPIDARRAMTP